jgi:hypothetical protein
MHSPRDFVFGPKTGSCAAGGDHAARQQARIPAHPRGAAALRIHQLNGNANGYLADPAARAELARRQLPNMPAKPSNT